jgi:outer membrane protein OmpA-like peptidoglycan-associated protein
VPRSRIEVQGYGPDRPLAGTSRNSPQNRRVEAVRVS